jgi:hypothetical protein
LQPLPGRVVDKDNANVILQVSLRNDKEESARKEKTLTQEDIDDLFQEMPLWRSVGQSGRMLLQRGSEVIFKARKCRLPSSDLVESGTMLFDELKLAHERIFKSLYDGQRAEVWEAIGVDVILASDSEDFDSDLVSVPKLDGYDRIQAA